MGLAIIDYASFHLGLTGALTRSAKPSRCGKESGYYGETRRVLAKRDDVSSNTSSLAAVGGEGLKRAGGAVLYCTLFVEGCNGSSVPG
jgi:hypothetical protein